MGDECEICNGEPCRCSEMDLGEYYYRISCLEQDKISEKRREDERARKSEE
jgi:hypothetical protein